MWYRVLNLRYSGVQVVVGLRSFYVTLTCIMLIIRGRGEVVIAFYLEVKEDVCRGCDSNLVVFVCIFQNKGKTSVLLFGQKLTLKGPNSLSATVN